MQRWAPETRTIHSLSSPARTHGETAILNIAEIGPQDVSESFPCSSSSDKTSSVRGASLVRQDQWIKISLSRYEGHSEGQNGEPYSGACLREASLSSFIDTATRYAARCRQVIYYQGKPTNGVYLIESGRIKCTSTASDGRELLLCEFVAGELFGLVEALNDAPAVATAVATEASILKFVRSDKFRSLIADDAELMLLLVQVLAQRLKAAYERSTDLAYESLERRVLRTLGKLACMRDGIMMVERSLSINELANMVAASRTRVSLAVQDLIRRKRLNRIEGKFVLIT
jgi:CRP/FNR family transcriptional regulator, cyclic AMP receptor protein